MTEVYKGYEITPSGNFWGIWLSPSTYKTFYTVADVKAYIDKSLPSIPVSPSTSTTGNSILPGLVVIAAIGYLLWHY